MEQRVGDPENSLEKIKRQLASGSGRSLLQGPLLKRSETLRKWNERWVILDPTTGKMEYKTRRNEPTVKGTITFDENSTIAISPVNFKRKIISFVQRLLVQLELGFQLYSICYVRRLKAVTIELENLECISILSVNVGNSNRENVLGATNVDYDFNTMQILSAAQLVLKAHKEAVNSLSGNGSAKLGTVATVVAAANSTAQECSKEIEAAMQISLRNALGTMTNRITDGPMDDLSIMKETLRVKDEELQNLARDLRARDSTIRDIADKLSETAEAAEAAASAAHTMDEQRRIACAEIERINKESTKQLKTCVLKLKEYEEKVSVLSKERDQLIKQRDSAIQEAHLWRSELAKARERVVILEAAVVRGEEKVRVAEADAEARIKEAAQKEAAAVKGKEELLAYVNILQAQLQRQQIDTKQVFEEKTESSNMDNSLPQTKDVDLSDENVDKACLSVSRAVPEPGASVVHMTVDQVNLQPIGDGEWSDIQATEARIADVREVAPETEGSSLDIPVVSPPVNNHHEQGTNSFHQP
ncbi:PH domain-containing protein [Citrus sinensis]|uniref:PH domain-containing protein n=1 Tax=Citrus sinensis TaxID=2711 RepID=A0ACB8LAT0_CITSI|nr:PH domain-containing protein [Citrus sinensis]